MATLEALKRALGTSATMTVFRRLKLLRYRTSYSHRGRYYTLADIPRFDEQGAVALSGRRVFPPRQLAGYGSTVCGRSGRRPHGHRTGSPAGCRRQGAAVRIGPAQAAGAREAGPRVRILFAGAGPSEGTTGAAREPGSGVGGRGLPAADGVVGGTEGRDHPIPQPAGRAAAAALCGPGSAPTGTRRRPPLLQTHASSEWELE